MPHQLIENWRGFDPEASPSLYEGDIAAFDNNEASYCLSLDEWYRLDRKERERCFHLALLPKPFGGDIEHASIYLLLLNAGFAEGDYAELADETLKRRLLSAIHQTSQNECYPFLSLDPVFRNHPGAKWWRRHLHDVAEFVARKITDETPNIEDGYRFLSRHMAVLEWLPYHSQRNPYTLPREILEGLHSTRDIVAFVHETILPRAEDGEALIVVARAERLWNLPAKQNIVIYDRGEVRRASLSSNSRGFSAITRFLMEKKMFDA